MADPKKIASEARIALTDLRTVTLNGSDGASPLKMTRMIAELERELTALSAFGRQSLLDKLKDAMIEDQADRDREAACRAAAELTYQLRLCRGCLCADCAAMTVRCRCRGCLYGSRVTQCSKAADGIELRVFEPGVAFLEGEPLLRAEYDRKNGICAVTVRQANGLERRFLHDLT